MQLCQFKMIVLRKKLLYANSCLSPKDVEKKIKIVPYYCDEEINSGKLNVLTRIQYYDTLDLTATLLKDVTWSEWELDLQRL